MTKHRNLFTLGLLLTLVASAGASAMPAGATIVGRRVAAVRPISYRAAGALPPGDVPVVTGVGPETVEDVPYKNRIRSRRGAPSAVAQRQFAGTNRSPAKIDAAQRSAVGAAALTDPEVDGVGVAGSSRKLRRSFEGLNHYQKRFANNGNQFSAEPPDQALCVGNGYVLESVNTVLRVYRTSGAPASGVIDLNSFYGFPAEIDRTNFVFGPSLFDPICHYDSDTKRWFHVAARLNSDPVTGNLTGESFLDLAVSDSADPTKSWSFYTIDVSLDSDGAAGAGPFLGDYPQIGADENGFYITTNSFPLFEDGYGGAQLYALSKEKLVDATIDSLVYFDDLSVNGQQGYTVQAARSPGNQFENDNDGTEYMLSSLTGFSFYANQIALYALTNTESLADDEPALALNVTTIDSVVYGDPPATVEQKAGVAPLGVVEYGLPQGEIAMNDSRMHQTYFADGLVWGALTTAVEVDGERHAGIAYFIVDPDSDLEDVSMEKDGYIAVEGNNLAFPAIAVTRSGRAVMTMTLVGEDYYPSTAFARLFDDGLDDDEIYLHGRGVGPQDGFTEYEPFFDDGTTRPRWGDYSAAATDGTTIWIATPYIAQSCTVAEFTADPTCGATRSYFANWSTRVSSVRP